MSHASWGARFVGIGLVVAAIAAIVKKKPRAVTAPSVAVPDNPLWRGTTKPAPVPEQNVVLSLPKDMYRHADAPTEWWWHIGTLRAGDRVFGFDINAASFNGQHFGMSQISLSDVQGGRHYERTQVYGPKPFGVFDVDTWAEGDPSKQWYAGLGDPGWLVGGFSVTDTGSGYTEAPSVHFEGDGTGASAIAILDDKGGVTQIILLKPGSGYTTTPAVTLVGGGGSGATAVAVRHCVVMTAPQADPTRDISVTAILQDAKTLDEVEFDLTLSQQGRPMFIFGTGVEPSAKTQSLQKDNYYYSYTRLTASGTIRFGGETHAVTGTTWMDHEYGFFGGNSADTRVRWLLQDIQLDNGYTLSTAGMIGEGYKPEIGVSVDAFATIQDPDGQIYYVASVITPVGELWRSASTGNSYAQQFQVEIPSFQADILVSTRLQDQEFSASGAPIYEGTAEPTGTFLGESISGDAWIEQAF